MTLEFELREQEFLDYYYYVNWSSPEMRPSRLKYYTTNLGLYIAGVFVLIFWRAGFIPGLLWIIPLGAVVLLYGSKLRQSAVIDERGQKFLKLVGREKILGKQTLTLASEGIEISKQHSQSKLRWNKLYQIRKVSQCYYLFTTPKETLIVPFRVFHSDDELKDFEKYFLLPVNSATP